MRSDYLQQEFEAKESPGLETFDPRLEEISTAMMEGNYDAALEPVASVFDEGVLDVRVAGYYGYLVFHEEGLGALSEVLDGLASMLLDRWDALGPAKNREKITVNSFSWFYKQLTRKLQREESSQGPGWSTWIDTVSSEEVEEMLEQADRLRRGLTATLEDLSSPLLDLHGKVSEWLQAFSRVVYREPEPEPEPEPEELEELEEPEDDDSFDGGEPATAAPAFGAAPAPVSDAGAITNGGVMVEGSIHLRLLLRKIEAFERLIEQEKYPRAALAADDISQTLSEFDPLLYFPRVFARFARLLAVHVGELAEYEDAKDTRDWQALQAFYAADLDGFVEE